MNLDKWISVALSKDITREHLCAVQVDPGGYVAVDGHRMHTAPDTLGPVGSSIPRRPSDAPRTPIETLIPAGAGVQLDNKTLRRLRTICRVAGKLDAVQAGRGNARRVFLAMAQEELEVRQAACASVLFMALPGIVLARLPMSDAGDGLDDRAPVCLNAKYLDDALTPGDGGAKILLGGKYDPIKVSHDDGRIAVVMPIQW